MIYFSECNDWSEHLHVNCCHAQHKCHLDVLSKDFCCKVNNRGKAALRGCFVGGNLLPAVVSCSLPA